MLLGIKYHCCYCLLLSVAHSWCSAAGLGSGGNPRHGEAKISMHIVGILLYSVCFAQSAALHLRGCSCSEPAAAVAADAAGRMMGMIRMMGMMAMMRMMAMRR